MGRGKLGFFRARLAHAALAAAFITLFAGGAHAQTLIRLLSFAGASNLPIWFAQDKGFFASEGVDVAFATTGGSVEQIRDFYAGKADIISTAFDNIVAYAEGQSDIPLPGPNDMVAFLGVHEGLNSLMVRPEIKNYADIKGQAVAVDALKSGYGIVLYEVLRKRGGLTLDKDYRAISVGDTNKRLEAMRDKRAVAAIIGDPQNMQAEREGFRTMADAAAEVAPYQGSAFVARRPWAEAHAAALAPFIRAIAAATDAIFARKADAIAVLRAHLKGLSAEEADPLYARLVGPGGLSPHAAMTIPGVETVLRLRADYGEPRKAMGPVSRYVDTGFYQRALATK